MKVIKKKELQEYELECSVCSSVLLYNITDIQRLVSNYKKHSNDWVTPRYRHGVVCPECGCKNFNIDVNLTEIKQS